MITQSGAFGTHLLALTARRGISVGVWMSTGNEAEVQVADGISFLADDPDTKAIACYMEAIQDGERFATAVKRARENGKPVIAMKVGGSLYLLYLALRIGRAGALERVAVARPLGLAQAAAFQLINPKAWIFAIGAVTTFRPTDLPVVAGSLLVALTMMLVVVPTARLWALGGGAISRLVSDARARRTVGLVLAALVAATVAYVWV